MCGAATSPRNPPPSLGPPSSTAESRCPAGCLCALLRQARAKPARRPRAASPRPALTLFPSFPQATESKREQFRRYLEKSGVLDTLTKVLVALYEEPEKPNNALDFLKHHIGAAAPENPEIEALPLEVAEMKEKYEAVLEENKKLKAKLSQYEPPPEEKRGE
ncbi:c-Myc-binding protein-like [Mauremys mutica]|uniref:c-Myc-binding protein-like n=1 Tax=Mauremys mutica TaxID=74926 RepID=UPI001D14D398|nr:c-Myc-binding protein-like [Mauremys mutica]